MSDTVSIELPVLQAKALLGQMGLPPMIREPLTVAVQKHDAEHRRFRAEPDARHSWTVWTRNLCVARFYDDDGSWDHRAEAEALAERLNAVKP